MSLPSTVPSLGRRRFAAAAAAFLAAGRTWAQAAWPAKGATLNWVVPYPAGGTTDVLGRHLAQRLSGSLGVNVIVNNKPGATGTIGAAFVAKAAPDGMTLLGTSIGPQAIAPHLMGKLPYDPLTAFAPVALVGVIPHILVTGSAQPYKSMADLLAAARAQPGKLAYASGGNGTVLHMQGELLAQQKGLDLIHAPYQGDTPALQDTLGGQVQFMFAPASAALPHVRAGKLRALAVTSAQRLPALPDVPTMAEAGVADFVVQQWQGVFAPAGTPQAAIERLNRDINAALAHESSAALAERLGITLEGGAPQRLADTQKADWAKWGAVIRKAGIRAG